MEFYRQRENFRPKRPEGVASDKRRADHCENPRRPGIFGRFRVGRTYVRDRREKSVLSVAQDRKFLQNARCDVAFGKGGDFRFAGGDGEAARLHVVDRQGGRSPGRKRSMRHGNAHRPLPSGYWTMAITVPFALCAGLGCVHPLERMRGKQPVFTSSAKATAAGLTMLTRQAVGKEGNFFMDPPCGGRSRRLPNEKRYLDKNMADLLVSRQ